VIGTKLNGPEVHRAVNIWSGAPTTRSFMGISELKQGRGA